MQSEVPALGIELAQQVLRGLERVARRMLERVDQGRGPESTLSRSSSLAALPSATAPTLAAATASA